MNDVRQSWFVAARELRERGRSRAFQASLVLMCIGIAAAIALPGLLDNASDTRDVGLTGAVPPELAAAVQQQGEAVDTTVRVHSYETVTAGEDAVRDGDVDVLIVDGVLLEWAARPDDHLKAVVTGAVQIVAVGERASAAGLGPGELAALVEPVPVTSVELGQVAGRSPDDETAALVMTLVLFGAISTFGAMVLGGVVEEKSSRTVEVLLARVPARNLLAGKIVGIGLLGLAQIVATAAVALVAVALVDSVDIPAVRGSVIAWAVVWFVLGYALYATVYGTLGSLASRTEDSSSVTGPVAIVLVLAFIVSFSVIGSADATWARLVAWFPLTAPLAMPNLIAMGAATWWDPIVAAILTVAAIAGLVVLGGRVYTRAILHTGTTLSLADAWHGVPVSVPSGVAGEQTPATGPVEAVTPAATSTATIRTRTQVVLVVIAVALGGAVFAVGRDFVISVAVSAVFYALAVRVAKAVGPSRPASKLSSRQSQL